MLVDTDPNLVAELARGRGQLRWHVRHKAEAEAAHPATLAVGARCPAEAQLKPMVSINDEVGAGPGFRQGMLHGRPQNSVTAP